MNRIELYNLLYKSLFSGFIVFCVYFLIWSDIGLVRYYSLKSQIETRKRDLLTLRREIWAIEGAVDRWKKNPFFLEKMAREELGMGYPNEKVCFYHKK
ncbi:septum formation initiator family protein [Candidatus Dependentiae bacterium]|nr:septum formation initiator family protein [Candidatus Dependentiae bacterium]